MTKYELLNAHVKTCRMCVTIIDIHGRSQNLCHLDSDMVLKLGVLDCGLSGAYITCIYRGLSVKINMHKTSHSEQRSWKHLYCICFYSVVGKNLVTPSLSHYLGHYRRSGIPRVYLWLLSNAWLSKLYHVMPMKYPCDTHKLYMWYVHTVHVIFTGAHMVYV